MTSTESREVATDTPALRTEGLSVTRPQHGRRVPITDAIDLFVRPGESIAIVGESGSGKSVTARAILDLLPHGLTSDGHVDIGGRAMSAMTSGDRRDLRGSDVAFIMQDPFTMLNPLQRTGAQVTARLRDQRGRPLRRAARRHEAQRMLAEVGIVDPSVVDLYPFELSGGMRQRVAIAAAIAENPKVLIADEPTTALDVTTQKEILELLKGLRDRHHLGMILITHDLRVAFSVCDRVYAMYAGEVVETASSHDLLTSPAHPYTASLMAADPPLDRRVDSLANIPGSVPAPDARPRGCRFAPRCGFVTDACRSHHPELEPVDAGEHLTRCIRAGDIRQEMNALAGHQVASTAPSPTTSGVPLITTRNLRRTYGSKVAVAGASIDVFPGESVGLVGESGSGKTTLARMLVGLTRPTSGFVSVSGVELATTTSRRDWETVRSTVQMAFQDPYSTLNPQRTVGSTLRDALSLVSRSDIKSRTAALLQQVGLPANYAARMPAQLSGGERQRVAIARALGRAPRIVVCDEIVSALDVSVQAHVLNLLRDLQRDLRVGYVFITHDLAVVRQVTDRVYVLQNGEIVEHGATGHVLDHPTHDYTRRLLASVPQVDHQHQQQE